ncbi:MAG: DUF3313 domain-containing protein [Candidatus Hydrogenedentota bacterium]|nr:MAG: DUF3313 domain-containing protein [Candidatus Hydrogenedentota bacterium]
MMRSNSWVFMCAVAVLLACVLGAGCASSPKVERSGFLSDYSGLEPGPKGGAEMAYVKSGIDWSSYDSVLIEPVVVWYSPNADYQGIHPRELVELADYFEQALVENLEDKYAIVGRPGPGVLRVRVAITNVEPSNPTMDTVSAVVPQMRLVSAAKKGVTGTHMYVGEASMEAEIYDSQTNERLAAAIDTRAGEKEIFDEKDKWADAREAMDSWAERLRQRLDEGFIQE